ncbi:MAG: LamG-like jellyroll fold domain-containing protein, partial [Pirellulales bacterium]
MKQVIRSTVKNKMACFPQTRPADPKAVVFDNGSWVCMCFALAACLVAKPGYSAEGETGRVKQDLVVLYTFAEPSGDVIHDRSGAGKPLDLRIETPQAVSRQNGRFAVSSSARIVSAGPAKKLIDAIKQSGELTLETWVLPRGDRQGGPARIMSLSADPGQRNFTLGQERDRYDVRLRTTKTDGNGIPSLSTPPSAVQADLTHIAFTRDRTGNTRIYVHGRQQAAGKAEGDLSGWSQEFRLSLANELTGDR